MEKKAQHDYYAYLLRLWREEGERKWRASLENPGTGQKRGFASFERLVKYLAELMQDSAWDSESVK